MWFFCLWHGAALLLLQVFDLFDVKQDGVIEFGEFVRSLSVFHPNIPMEDKINCQFLSFSLSLSLSLTLQFTETHTWRDVKLTLEMDILGGGGLKKDGCEVWWHVSQS